MHVASSAQRKIIDRLDAGATLALSPRSGRYELADAGKTEQLDQRPVIAMLRDGVLQQEVMTGNVVMAEPAEPPAPPRRRTAAEQAADMRAAMPPARMVLAFAGWPRGEDIGARENFDVAPYLKGLPTPAARRIAELNSRIAAYRLALAREVARYNEILTYGPQALSDYDLVIAYSGNTMKACKGALGLVDAHISFNRSILAGLRADLAALGGAEAPAGEPPVPDDFSPGSGAKSFPCRPPGMPATLENASSS